MQSTFDLSSQMERGTSKYLETDNKRQHLRTIKELSGNGCRSELVTTAGGERNWEMSICETAAIERGSEFCVCSSLSSSQSCSLTVERECDRSSSHHSAIDATSSCRRHGHSSVVPAQPYTSLPSCDVLCSKVGRNRPKYHSSEYRRTNSYSSATINYSNFQHTLHFKSKQAVTKPPVLSTHLHHNKTFLYPFLFTIFILSSLISPSLSSNSPPTSPNLNSWSLSALETIDHAGAKHEISKDTFSIPDVTAIVGKLFQFQIPESAFDREISIFKATQAGSKGLPRWLHFDKFTGLLTGVPLPQDKGQIYINVDGHTLNSGVQSSIFSLNVVQVNISNDSRSLSIPHLLDQARCSHSSPDQQVDCLPNEKQVLANILFLFSFDSLTPLERAGLFTNTATLFDVCLEHLELRAVDWTSSDGVWLWSKLATGEIIESLEMATILSFPIGCERFDYLKQSSILELVSLSTEICQDGLLLTEDSYAWVTCHQWFITAGSDTFISQVDVSGLDRSSGPVDQREEGGRVKRQLDGPGDLFPPDLGGGGGGGDDEMSTSILSKPSSTAIETSISITPSTSLLASSSTSLLLSTAQVSAGMSSSTNELSPVSTSSGIQVSSFSPSISDTQVVSGSSMAESEASSSQPTSSLESRQVSTYLPSVSDTMFKSSPTSVQSLATVTSSTSAAMLSTTSAAALSTPLPTSSTSRSIPMSPSSVQDTTDTATSEPSSSSLSIRPIEALSTQPVVAMSAEAIPSLAVTPSLIRPSETLTVGSAPAPSSLSSSLESSSTSSSEFEGSGDGTESRFPTSSRQLASPATTMATPQPSLTATAVASSRVFSSIEVSEVQTRIPFLTVSGGSSLVDISNENTQVMMFVTPTPSTSLLSFSIASTIEILSSSPASSVEATPSPLTSSASFDIQPTDTFLFSMATSNLMMPLTSTSGIDFVFTSSFASALTTIIPTPVRTTNVLMPLPTSELSLSLSVFTPTSLPMDTSSVALPMSTSTVVSSEPIITSLSSDVFMFDTATLSPEMSSLFVVTPSPTRLDSRLVPMSSSELTLSVSMFSPDLTIPSSTVTTTFEPAPSSISLEPTPSPSLSTISELPSFSTIIDVISSTSSFVFVEDSSESFLFPFTTSIFPPASPSVSLSSIDIASSMPAFSTEDIVDPFPTPTPLVTSTPIMFSISSLDVLPTPSSTSPSISSSLPFTSTTSSLESTPTPSPPFTICDVIDCNNGTCVEEDFGFDFTCQCFIGWTGEFCDILLPTSSFISPVAFTSSPVMFVLTSSESLLLPLTTSMAFTSTADIRSLSPTTSDITLASPSVSPTSIFISPTPTVNVSMCDFINCNNGECIDLGSGTVFCECDDGFAGMFCESFSSSIVFTMSPSPTPIDICDLVDCNNGTCVPLDFGDDYICECFPGFTGDSCDVIVQPSPSLATTTSVTTDIRSTSVLFVISSSESLLLPFSTPILTTTSLATSFVSSLVSSTSSFSPTSSSTSSSLAPTSILVSPTSSPFDPCDLDCINGECILIFIEGEFPVCECFPGWTGMLCDTPLPSSSSSPIFVATPTPSPPFDICDMIDCNNGTCIPVAMGDDFICECFAEFTGEFCDIPTSLSSSVSVTPVTVQVSSSSIIFLISSSESVLVPLATSAITTQSLPTLMPTSISISPTPTPDVSPCEDFNCSNGVCVVDLESELPMCECDPGYTGMFCEVPLVPSSSSMALTITPSPSPPIPICDLVDCNNGTCITLDFGDNFTCECFAGWTGDFCDIPLETSSLLGPSLSSMSPSSSMFFFVSSSESLLAPFSTSMPPSIPTLSPSATPSPTVDISLCDFINCTNGNCTELGNDTVMCECFPGWTGMFCDSPLLSSSLDMFTISPTPSPTPSPCDFIDCNNGTCMADITGSNITCECFVGWTGEFCDVLLPSTSPSPSLIPSPTPSPPPPACDFINCSGNGECTEDETGFTCSCYVGWTGPLCEIDIDYCLLSKFGNCNQTGTAMCVDGNSTNTCSCLPGFTGDLCSIDIDECDPNPCENKATCVNLLFGAFICECPSGFTGMLCNVSLSPCDPNPCMLPEEICIITGAGAKNFMCVLPSTTTIGDVVSTTAILQSSPLLSSSAILTSSLVLSPTPTPVPPNNSPILLNPIGTLFANEGAVTYFTIPEETFYDVENGTTSYLRLTLLDSSANPFANTTWIHLMGGAIQAFPLREQAANEPVTEYTFILRATDGGGASAHDFVTIRVIRQQVDFQNFLVVTFEGVFVTFSQNLTERILLARGLSAHISGSSIATVTSTNNVYIRAFRNGSIAVVYRDISIADSHCADFRAWVDTVYSFSESRYSISFLASLSPHFTPISSPVIEGPCNMSDINPTAAATQRISPGLRSDIYLFLVTVIPTLFVAILCLFVGIMAFFIYRSRRAERDGLRSKAMSTTFTNRQAIILDDEWDLPNRRRRPVILPGDRQRGPGIAAPVGRDGNRRRRLLEEVDLGGAESESSDEEDAIVAPGLTIRNRYAAMSPDPPEDEGPPPYVLPPLYPTELTN